MFVPDRLTRISPLRSGSTRMTLTAVRRGRVCKTYCSGHVDKTQPMALVDGEFDPSRAKTVFD